MSIINKTALINELLNISSLQNRYDILKCVNGNNLVNRGALSLVFQATDTINKNIVALKFMDPDKFTDTYRMEAFRRESDILSQLIGKNRVLQLTADIDTYEWNLDLNGNPVTLGCEFFASEWLEENVDDYFYLHNIYNNKDKLKIFRSALLAVKTVHDGNLFHRDLKIDNLRLRVVNNKNIVVVIDFGTAANIHSNKIATSYRGPVGAPGFSAPETFIGFTADRKICQCTDMYALGTLLFDLFNTVTFNSERASTQYSNTLKAIALDLSKAKSESDKFKKWKKCVNYFNYRVDAPNIDHQNNCISPNIMVLVKKLYSELTEFDFNKRLIDINKAVKLVDTMLRIIDNDKRNKKILLNKKKESARRKIKNKEKENKLSAYLNQKKVLNNVKP